VGSTSQSTRSSPKWPPPPIFGGLLGTPVVLVSDLESTVPAAACEMTIAFGSAGCACFALSCPIINIYLTEVVRKLRETLKARHVQVYEHTVSTSAKHHIRQALLTVISFEDVMRPIPYPLERSTHLISLRTLRTLAGISWLLDGDWTC